MRLLCYSENHARGGGNKYFIDALKSLAATHQVTVWSNRGSFTTEELRSLSEIGITPVPLDIWNLPLFSARFAQKTPFISPLLRRVILRLLRLPIQLVSLRQNARVFRSEMQKSSWEAAFAFNGGLPGALSCLEFLRCAQRQSLQPYLSVVSVPVGLPKLWYLRFRRTFFATKVITNCALAKTRIDELVATKSIAIVHNPGPLPATGPHRSSLWTKTSGIQALKMVYVGRLEAMKGTDLLLEAFALAAVPGLTLTLIGDNCLGGRLGQLIAKYELTGLVSIRGFTTQPIDTILPDFDIFVFPSRWEGLPYAVMEAMAVGMPIVASKAGGIPELIEEGETGLLFDTGDASQLAAAIKRIATDHQLAARLGAAAKVRLAGEFSREIFEHQFRKCVTDR